jgi:hypothetical protein
MRNLGVIILAAGGVWIRSSGAAELTPREFKAGAKLNKSKCAKCHQLYRTADYSPEDWASWMEKMRKKARLKPPQFDLLTRYFEDERKLATEKAR